MSLESVFANPPPLVGAESSSREEDFDKSDDKTALDLEDGELEDGELDDEDDGGGPPPPPAATTATAAAATAAAPSLSRESSKEDHKESHSGHKSGDDESKRGGDGARGDGDRRRNPRDQNRKRRRDQRQERDRRDRGPKSDRGSDRGGTSHRKRKKGRYHDYDNMGDDDMPSTSWSGGYERAPYDSPGRSPSNRSEHYSRDSDRHKPPQLDQRSPPGPYDSPTPSDDEYGPPPVLDRLDSGGENYGGGSMFSMLGDEYMDANVAANEQEEMFTKPTPGYRSQKKREKSEKYYEKKRRLEREHDRGGKGRDRGQPRQKRDCKYFLEGTCRQGDKCPFFHDQERAPKPRRQLELCKYFLNSICTKGSDCIYMHGDYPCKFYHRGGCKEGDKCQFSHQPLNEVTQGIIDKIDEEERAEHEGRSRDRDSERSERPRDRERKYSHDDSEDRTDNRETYNNRADHDEDKFKDGDYNSRSNDDYWSSKDEYRSNEEFGSSDNFTRSKADFGDDYDDKRAGGKDNFRSPQKKPSILGDGPSHLYKKSVRDHHNKRGGPPLQKTDPKKIPSLLDMKITPPPPRPTGPPPNMMPPPDMMPPPGMPLSPAHRPMRPGFYGDMGNSPIRGPIPGPGILGRPPLLPPPPMGPMGPIMPPPGLLPPPPPGMPPPPGVPPPTSQAAELFMNMLAQNLQQINNQKAEEGSGSPADPTTDPEFLQHLAPKQRELLKRMQQGDGDSPSTTDNPPDNSQEDQNWYSSDEETGNDKNDNGASSADTQFNMLRKASSLPTPQGSGNGFRDPRMTPSSSTSSFQGDPRAARSDPRSASSTPGRPDPRSFKPPLLVKPALKKQKSDNEVFINGSMTISGGVPYFLYKITTDTRPCLPVGMDLENPPYEGDPRLKKYHKPGPVLTDVTSPTMLEVAKVDPRRTSLDASPSVDPRSRNKSMSIAIPPKPEPLEVILPDLKHSQSDSKQSQSRIPSADSLPKLLDPRYARQLSIGEKKEGELKSPPPGSVNKPAFSHRNDPRFKKKVKATDNAPLLSPGSGSEPDKQSGDEHDENKNESMETEDDLLVEAPTPTSPQAEDMDNDAGNVDDEMLDTDNAEKEDDLLPKEEAPSVYRPPPKSTRMEFASPLGNLDDTLPEDQYGAYGRPQKRSNDNNKRDSNLPNKSTSNSSHVTRVSPPTVTGDEAGSQGSNSPNTAVDYPGLPSMLANNMDTSKEEASPQNVRDMFNSIDPTASPFC